MATIEVPDGCALTLIPSEDSHSVKAECGCGEWEQMFAELGHDLETAPRTAWIKHLEQKTAQDTEEAEAEKRKKDKKNEGRAGETPAPDA